MIDYTLNFSINYAGIESMKNVKIQSQIHLT